MERDVFDEEVKNEPPIPHSTLENLKNAVEEGDLHSEYLSDVRTEDNDEQLNAPQLSISKSEKQPIYYFGESGPGGMAVMQQAPNEEVKAKNNAYNSSDSDSDYRSPTPVELSIQESP